MAKSQKNKKSNSSSNSRSSSHSNSRSTSRSNSNSGNKRKRTKKQKKDRRKLQKYKRRVQKGGDALGDFKIIFVKFYTFTNILKEEAESDAKYDKLQKLLQEISQNIIKFLNNNQGNELRNLRTKLTIINYIVKNVMKAINTQNSVIKNLDSTEGSGTYLKRQLYEKLINKVINIYFTEIRDLYNFYTELFNLTNLNYGNITDQQIYEQKVRVRQAHQKFKEKFGTDSIIKNTNNPNMGKVDFELLKK